MRALVLLFVAVTSMIRLQAAVDSPRQSAEHAAGATFTFSYLLALPAGYDADPAHRWPLVVFLHGIAERGTDVDRLRHDGLPREIEAGRALPCVVISPQCPVDEWWNAAALEAFIDDAIHRYRIDADRVYLTGLSMGGFGTWTLATRHPERYAAIVPICGGGEPKDAARLRDLPIWAFHGALDHIVSVARSQEMVDAIRAAGGHPRLTIYPDLKHISWRVTYANDELYPWLLAQRRRPPDIASRP